MSSFDVSIKRDAVIDLSNHFTFHVGGFAEISINGIFFIQPELLFSSKGACCKLSETYTIDNHDEEGLKLKNKTFS